MLTIAGAYSLDNSATDEPSTTIKLFGKTVVLNESQKLSPSATESETTTNDEELVVTDGQHFQNSATTDADPKFAFPFVPGSITPLPWFVPQYALSDECSHAGLTPGSIPWWALYQGVIFPPVSFGNQTADSPYKREQQHELREGSLTSSNSGSTGEVNSLQKKTVAVECKGKAKLLKHGSSRGFVPYKRCLAERDATSVIVAAEEHKGQKYRVCL